MSAVVDAAQPPAVDMRVDLRGGERAVAEEFLDRPQVSAAFEQVGRERVPQPVRVRKHTPQRARVEAPATHGDEERVFRAGGELWPRLVQVPRDPMARLLAERNRALLAALAAHVNELLLEVDVAEVETCCLAAAQSGRIDELEQRPVPQL